MDHAHGDSGLPEPQRGTRDESGGREGVGVVEGHVEVPATTGSWAVASVVLSEGK